MARTDSALELIAVMFETIRDAGEDGIPSGYLYAAVMGLMGLETYQLVIAALKRTGKVRESGHVLYVVK